jgi:hypothetical protein
LQSFVSSSSSSYKRRRRKSGLENDERISFATTTIDAGMNRVGEREDGSDRGS